MTLNLTTQPALGLDGESPVIGYTYDDRFLAVVAWHEHKGSTYPVVSLRCHCGDLIPAADLVLDTIAVARVNGDSMYGYEAYHLACY